MGELIKRLRFLRYFVFFFVFKLLKRQISDLKKEFEEVDEVIIVCNGPSLNEVDLSRLKFPCIAMNKIDLIFDKTTWRPKLVVVNNGLVIRQNRDAFNESSVPVVADVKGLFLGLKTPYFFLPHFKREFSTDFQRWVGTAGTVTYTALQLAYYLGFKKVHIIGMDHNYFGHDTAKSKSSIETFEGDDVNHFHPDYFKNELWGTPNLYVSERGYKNALKVFEESGGSIVDRTTGGKCNIFPKGPVDVLYN